MRSKAQGPAGPQQGVGGEQVRGPKQGNPEGRGKTKEEARKGKRETKGRAAAERGRRPAEEPRRREGGRRGGGGGARAQPGGGGRGGAGAHLAG